MVNINSDKTITDNYELLIRYSTREDEHPGIIGNKENKKCRFLNHNNNQQSFFKDAHVAPEGIGNRRFLSHHECDYCNEYFGNTIEDDFNKYLDLIEHFIKWLVKGVYLNINQ